ncbi:MAG: porphobilinogen synthase [Spirosomataceae bacterium]
MSDLLTRRPRRNRKSAAIREMIAENHLRVSDFIYPMFIQEGEGVQHPIPSMPGIFRYSIDTLLEELVSVTDLGISTICLFPHYPDEKKDRLATESIQPDTLYLRAIRAVKARFPDLMVMTDVAMDPYSSDGHDGLVQDGAILNDETLEILGKMAVAQAEAGADILGPSDMMDGRVGYLRSKLDQAGFNQVSIMSYTAKYASAFYGPFRDALSSAPKFGDKKTYQMNPANQQEALVEGELDMMEGADFLMVKPALSYLDVIQTLHTHFPIPIAAYNVSGEYAMIKAAGEKGWVDEKKVMMEVLLSMKRAGASVILTYFAKDAAKFLKDSN